MSYVIIQYIPLIHIGHVIYEMSSGHVLSGVVPTEEEYERVRYDEIKKLLQFIFGGEVRKNRLFRLQDNSYLMEKVSIIISN